MMLEAVVFFLSLVTLVQGGRDYCTGYTYCEDGLYCCDYNTRCCSGLTIAAIVGIVIGGIIFISVVVAVICICVQKSQRRPGQVIHPNSQATTTVAYVGQQQPYGYGQQQYGNAQPPPVFGQQQHGFAQPQTRYGHQPGAPEYPPAPPTYQAPN